MNSEQKWLQRVKKSGDRRAADRLVSKYYKEMFAFVYKQTLDEELSRDLTQEIFINMLKSLKNYDAHKASFRTWLYKLASHRLIDYYRSRSYRDRQLTTPIEDEDIVEEKDMTISLEYKEDVALINHLLNEMDIHMQQVVRLKLFGEYTFQEIAALETMPESTVKTKYYTALRRIRATLKEANDD
ncbi:RNA polymerase sigma factor [Bacillaceae bacterium SIJ1]|uniref:RNA polymerase sigma factor n=1 Tax=Litoribacterium kuwaitense TaxID=1398745 RepID=UPI0013EDC01A|nr:RNA polymerase sigma factor [Litoribacterium kuwaitense]NGP46412.1 RNA polymerase sigma factor [Litoribacterium kuwaitense]